MTRIGATRDYSTFNTIVNFRELEHVIIIMEIIQHWASGYGQREPHNDSREHEATVSALSKKRIDIIVFVTHQQFIIWSIAAVGEVTCHFRYSRFGGG